ncbi:MAG: CDP-alcohol phosphatidyltransferase family protein, partial [Pseudomonadota bacterium]
MLGDEMELKSIEDTVARPTVRIIRAPAASQGPAAFSLQPGDRIRRQIGRLNLAEASEGDAAGVTLSERYLYGGSVISALARAPVGTVLSDARGHVAGFRASTGTEIGGPSPNGAVTGSELAGRYDRVLRKRTDPTVLAPETTAQAEQALFDASYKGVTDFVTKHVWPVPALVVTRWCAARGISPNQVTYASLVLVFLTFWLFWQGLFISGLVAAYAMTFLDTVDGKLARVTLTSSKFGDVLDHGTDLIHPPFWWWAWVVGCSAIGDPLADGGLALAVI